jgi:RimJ/RimL family protein N-acetyltransferase
MRIEPWGEEDLTLLQRLNGDPAMMTHVGGAESPRKIAKRHARYAADSKQFKIVDDDVPVGWVGYWEREWHGEQVYEMGWAVLPAAQGRGLATAATIEVIAKARAERERRFLHAFPSVDNAPSNAVCRKAGFTLLGAHAFEYPKGNLMQCNDWCVDLAAGQDWTSEPGHVSLSK